MVFFFFFFFFFFLVWIFPEQLFLSCTVLSISACCKIFFSDLMEAESRSGYSCSVPLNIITGVDNYTLRNGTEQSLVMAKQTPTICMILVSYSARVVRKYVSSSVPPSVCPYAILLLSRTRQCRIRQELTMLTM